MKKLESIWGSSRFMLPEHMQSISREMQDQGRRNKPVLDPDEWELIDQALGYSMSEREQITIVLFDPFTDIKVRGIVHRVNLPMRQIKIQMEEDYCWIKMDDVIRIIT